MRAKKGVNARSVRPRWFGRLEFGSLRSRTADSQNRRIHTHKPHSKRPLQPQPTSASHTASYTHFAARMIDSLRSNTPERDEMSNSIKTRWPRGTPVQFAVVNARPLPAATAMPLALHQLIATAMATFYVCIHLCHPYRHFKNNNYVTHRILIVTLQ